MLEELGDELQRFFERRFTGSLKQSQRCEKKSCRRGRLEAT